MSNLIVPLQRLLLGSSSFVPANLRLEFTERVSNLCAYSGSPMTPALRSWVEDTFGLEMVRIIQDFSTWDLSKLSPGLTNKIRRIVPASFDGADVQDSFVRLFNEVCCNTLYRYNLESEFGSPQPNYKIITPDTSNHTIQFPSDVVTVQQSGYELLSRTSSVYNPLISNIYFYGTSDQIANWQILNPNTLDYQELRWQEVGTACSTEKCYSYQFDVDELTYPSASIYDINNETADPFATPLTLVVTLFNNPSFNTELAELIQSMFGGNVSVTSSYDGSSYTITINYVQSIATTPTFPEFLNLLIDLDPGAGNFVYVEGIETTCP